MQTTGQISRLELPQGPVVHYLPMSVSTGRGVICVHCGTPVPLASRSNRSARRVSLLWCPMCLREAPYRLEDITDL